MKKITIIIAILFLLLVIGILRWNSKEEQLKAKANQGDIHAMYELGKIYESKGGKGNHSKAVNWYLKAAECGNTDAMCSLGSIDRTIYLYHDEKKATEWYLKAAELGNTDAMVELGTIYNTVMKRQGKKIVNWYLKAAELGNTDAMVMLGDIYEDGMKGWIYEDGGIEKDEKKAIEWYLKAIKGGHEYAMRYLAALYARGDSEKDEKKAAEWYLKAAQVIKTPDLMACLGRIYEEGIGVSPNYEEALKWYKKCLELCFSYEGEVYEKIALERIASLEVKLGTRR